MQIKKNSFRFREPRRIKLHALVQSDYDLRFVLAVECGYPGHMRSSIFPRWSFYGLLLRTLAYRALNHGHYGNLFFASCCGGFFSWNLNAQVPGHGKLWQGFERRAFVRRLRMRFQKLLKTPPGKLRLAQIAFLD